MQDNTLVYDYTPLIRLSDGKYPRYMNQVRADNNQSSFPIPVKAYMIIPFDHMPVYDSTKPNYDPYVEYLQEGPPSQNIEDEKWYKTWDIVEYTQEELETNLENEKSNTIGMAQGVLSNDLYTGITFNHNSQQYLVEVSGDKLALLLSVKSLAKEADESATFEYSFLGGETVELSKQDFLDMWSEVTNSVYNTNKNYWAFREEVKSKTLISDIPAIPDTFKA